MNTILELHPVRLFRMIEAGIAARKIVLFDIVDSTNLIGSGIVRRDCGSGTLLIADSQQEGRGRKNRTWFSASGKSLAFSLIVEAVDNQPELNILMAYSIVKAMDRFVEGSMIKWPNDVYLGGRKAAGILSEVSGNRVVIGVGMNINETEEDFPLEIRDLATSLRIAKGSVLDRGVILSSVVNAFDRNLVEWKKRGLRSFRDRLMNRLLYLGSMVVLSNGGRSAQGRYVDITDEGRIVLEINGERNSFPSGDLSLKEAE